MSEITRAVALLRAGELVAFPTETVYGLGGDASNPVAVAKVFAVKGRPTDHPLIVHLASGKQLKDWAIDIPDAAWMLARRFWPGPLTMILKRHPAVPDSVTGGQDTVGLRVPNHPLTLEMLRAFAVGQEGPAMGGLAAPSANRFGRLSPTTALHVRAELGHQVALILDGGPCHVGIESTIIDLSNGAPAILRPGMIGAAAINKVLPQPLLERIAQESPRVSGSLDSHYAPQTEMQLVPSLNLHKAVQANLDKGSRVTVLSFPTTPLAHLHLSWTILSSKPEEYAQALYASLRDLDQQQADIILVEAPPRSTAWDGIRDRLRRAALGAGEDTGGEQG